MEEKEMNKQILCQLYEVAKKIVSRLRLNPGAYTANEINKLNKKGGLFDGFEGKDEAVNIEVGAYSCTFPLHDIFYYVATFEKLAEVASNKKHSFIIEPENNHYLSKVVVRISKNDASLCNSVNMVKNDITYFQNNEVICLDVPRGEVCAVDGVTAQIKALQVVDRSEYDEDQTRPRIDGMTWKKMCNKAGKDGALLVCTLVNGSWVSECCGIVSTVDKSQGLSYHNFFANVDPCRFVGMDKKVWDQAKKWIKTNMGLYAGDANLLIIERSENCQFLVFRFKHPYNDSFASAQFPCTSTPDEYFCMGFNGKKILALNEFKMYVPTSAKQGAIFDDSDNVRLIMPLYDDECRMWHFDKVTYTADVFDLVQLAESTPIIEPRKNHQVSAHGKKAVAKPATKKAKKACKVVAMATEEKTGKKTTAKKDRAFSFDKIGLKVGDTIQFIDGTDVIVAENTMIEFCGEKFTLSGFARQFVPEDKKNKAGAYRGCCYFFYQGVRLDKLLKAALTKEEEEKDVQEVETVAVVQEESNEVATVQEDEKAVIIPISLHGAKWMEKFCLSSSVSSSTSVRRPGATSSRKWLATVATVPRCVGGVAVGKGYQVAAVGTVSQGSGKVVHELPLPPPRQKVALL